MKDQPISTPPIKDFRPFILCNEDNYAATKAFYADLGFSKLWDDGTSACEFATGYYDQRFLVTLHVGIAATSNGMLHFWVEDAGAWYEFLRQRSLEEKYPGVRVAAPVVTEWGWLITYVMDPSGLKLHFAEPHSDDNKAFFNAAPWLGDGA